VKEPIRIEELEEFEFVSRIPRSAITEDILSGVRQLNEVDEIEPFLREILSDRTLTPHTSTEIADILTTHMTRSGHPLLAAIVNKGRSYKKVAAKDVAHQIIRLQDVPNVSLMILLAVGDIHDDAKKVLLRTAENAKANYMIIDAIDVARLFIAFNKICPIDGVPYDDGKCKRCGASASEPVELTIKVHEELRYTIISQEDLSKHAKRYRATVLTDPHYSKAILREVIKKATWDLRISRFYHSKKNERLFGDKEADVVFLYVYLDNQDLNHANWICRTQWIRSDLSANDGRPASINGNEILGEIEILWNKDAFHLRDFIIRNRDRKEIWIQRIEKYFPIYEDLLRNTVKVLEDNSKGKLSEGSFEREFELLGTKAKELYFASSADKFPPFECEQCNAAFIKLRSDMDNIFLPSECWSKNKWIIKNWIEQYQRDRIKFLLEWEKLGRNFELQEQ